MAVWNPGSGSGGSATAPVAFGTAAARPAAATANKNTGYYATDTGELTLSDGSAWQQIGRLGNTSAVFNGTVYVGAGNYFYLDSSYGVTLQAPGGARRLNVGGDLDVAFAGYGLRVAEGANAKQGTATLVAGTVTVANTSVTATSRIFLTSQADGGTPGFLRVSARTAGTSFTITSSNAADTSTVAYQIFEVG